MRDPRLTAVILDFDGVILDSEPTHLAGFQAMLARVGRSLTTEDYYARYLGFDDRQAFQHMAADLGFALDDSTLRAWVEEKSRFVLQELRENPRVLPGAQSFVRSVADAGVALAIASGALRREVEVGLEAIGIRSLFRVIIGADDTTQSKPAPDPYLAALAGLRTEAAGGVAIEDSPAGILSACRAGLAVVGVTNSYPASELNRADFVTASLAQLTMADLARARSHRG
jgi:beta-phosphoglucomutase